MKQLKLMKTLLVAVGLLLGTSAWAAVTWKQTSGTAPSAGATLIDNDDLKVTTVFGTTAASSSKSIDGESFSYYIQVRNDALPTVGTPTGTEKSGSTSIEITTKRSGTIKLYYRRQSTSVSNNKGTYADNDGKDLKVYKQTDASLLSGLLTIHSEEDNGNYGFATKLVYLEAGVKYTLSAVGTTINFYGFNFYSMTLISASAVKMTYVNYNDADHSYGEIARGETAETGYNKIDAGSVGFGNTGWGVNYITYLQIDASILPEGAAITDATLTFEGSGSGASDKNRSSVYGAGYNSSVWSSEMTYNTADKSITTVGGTYETTSKKYTIFESVSLNIKDAIKDDADKIATIIVYETAADHSYIKNPKVSITYTLETPHDVTFTETNSVAATIKIGDDDVTAGVSLVDGDYSFTATAEGYDDYNGNFTIDGADQNVVFTMTPKTRYTFKVNATNSVGGAVIKTLYEDADSYEGKYHNLAYPKYLTGDNNIVTYSKDDDTYGEGKTAQAKNETYTVSYTAYDGVAYFVEVEDVVSSTDYSSWYCSNGDAVRGFTTAKSIFTIPATGVYDVTYAACNNNVNYDMAVTLSKNETEIATKSDFKSISINYIKSTGIVTNSNISLAKDDVLKLTPSTTNAIVDYMLIELKSVPATITSSTGYATFSSTHALDFSEVTGLTAYTATACDGTNVTLTPVSGTVAANTGLVIKGETTDIPVVATGDAQAGNLMHPCDGSWTTLSKSDTGTNYVLSEQGTPKVAVFAPIGATSATLRAGSAYLYVPTSDARTLNIVFDEDATGIASVKSESNAVNGYYNLAGQRIAQPTKGLYIVNGKKVVIK